MPSRSEKRAEEMAQQKRDNEEEVVRAAGNSDPNDQSPAAQHLRETADDIRDQWSSGS
ncbi:hypothetical protein [Amycolatopsis sp. NPDC059657]|uniref:hypothetical protein n=1 Tax=Amycolatopsis sp. NPDC059657 TaxID=3346899 RepID=UPI00366BC8F9